MVPVDTAPAVMLKHSPCGRLGGLAVVGVTPMVVLPMARSTMQQLPHGEDSQLINSPLGFQVQLGPSSTYI